jgi:hypothetical protein
VRPDQQLRSLAVRQSELLVQSRPGFPQASVKFRPEREERVHCHIFLKYTARQRVETHEIRIFSDFRDKAGQEQAEPILRRTRIGQCAVRIIHHTILPAAAAQKSPPSSRS